MLRRFWCDYFMEDLSVALPSGLSFGTSNGTIWGTTYMMLQDIQQHTVVQYATVNITVNDECSDTYNPDWFVLTNMDRYSVVLFHLCYPNSWEYSSIAIDSNGFKHIFYDDNYLKQLIEQALGSRFPSNGSMPWILTSIGRFLIRSIFPITNLSRLNVCTCSNGSINWVCPLTTNCGPTIQTIHISVYDEINEDLVTVQAIVHPQAIGMSSPLTLQGM